MARETNQIQMEGRNTVNDALGSDLKIILIKVSAGSADDPKMREIIAKAKKKGVRVSIVRPEEIEKESESYASQGVIAYVEKPETPTLDSILKSKRQVFILLLNRIDYEQNLGAIMRTAWAAGVDAVVASPNGVSEMTSVVAKVSMGAAAYVPLISMSLFQAIDLLKRNAVKIVGVEVDMGSDIWETDLSGSVALLLGGESAGLSEPLIKSCDEMMNIPMATGVASLNVSVASALAMFERRRQVG